MEHVRSSTKKKCKEDNQEQEQPTTTTTTTTSAKTTTTVAATTGPGLQPHISRQRSWDGPVTFTLRKKNDGYGFTLRYFVVYPPTLQKQGFNRDSYWLANGLNGGNDGNDDDNDENDDDIDDEAFVACAPAPLDTFFVKSVSQGGSAHEAGLKSGDRIVSINGDLIGGKRYKDVVELVQYCTGDLKLGVVPHQEDILQLVYQEYIYDDSNKLTVPHHNNNNNINNNNNNEQTFVVQRHSVPAMPQPSVNKWSAPLAPRKSLTIDGNSGGISIPSSINNNNVTNMTHGIGGGSGSSDNSSTTKKYDPCVGFFAGTPVISPESKASRSNSVTSSGSITPNRIGKSSGKSSGKGTPKRTSNGSTYDPCVAWSAGKPITNIEESTKENNVDNENFGIPPFKLQNALRKEQGKKPYSIGTRLAPKQIEGVSKPGAVSNIAGLFANGNWEELSGRKKSATSVLRDDFQILKSRTKSECHEENDTVQPIPKQQQQEQQLQQQGPMKFNLNVTVDSKRKTSESGDNEKPSPFDRGSTTYSSLPARYHQRKLSSNTSQATLVESNKRSKNKTKEGVTATLALNTIILNGGVGEGREKALSSTVTYRKRNLLGRGGRKVSVSSSVENTDDDDSHAESDDENELNNWKGRRISYLAANAKNAEKSNNAASSSHHAGADAKVAIDTQEADDEDSDANASPTNQRLKLNQKTTADEGGRKIKKEGALNRKLEKSLDSRKKANTRTWKPMYAVLKGHRLFCYKKSGGGDDDIIQPIPIRGSIIEVASDYVKKKNVFRMVTSHGNEYLFQAENSPTMMSWVNTLRDANPDKESLMKTSQHLKDDTDNHKTTKENKKGLSLRRSHFLRSSKKGRSSSNPLTGKIPKLETSQSVGNTFGIPLHACQMSKVIEKVPLLLEHCCTVIEEKGADVVGIYRIPGNAATIQLLRAELDIKDPESINWEEEKWQEVHNISSLLKAFLRQLDDPIVPTNMYTKFITVNRFQNQHDRLKSIRHLTRELPEYHYETLQYLIRHLKVIVEHSEKNKMDLKNLVTLFGPNIVKSDEVSSLVQDMPDQCKIIETLVKQYNWIFLEDSETAEPDESENDNEIISSDVSKALIECLNQNQKAPTTTTAVEQDINENVINNKKSNKFFNKFSMNLKSSKVTSPRSQKKKSSAAGNVSQDEDMETDDETSGCYSQSPPSSGKVEKRSNKFKSKTETRHVGQKLTMTIPSRQMSSENNGGGSSGTKIGQFTMNSDVQMNFAPGSMRSPELSPTMNHKGSGNHIGNIVSNATSRLTEKTLNRLNQSNTNTNNNSKYGRQTSDYDYKMLSKDDGNDSGVTSPQRLDSDSGDSGAHSRKNSSDSMASPLPQRRLPASPLIRQVSNSGSSNEERSPPLTNKSSAGKGKQQHEKLPDAVVNRSIRRAHKSKTMNNNSSSGVHDGDDKKSDTTTDRHHGKRETKSVKRSDSAVRRRQNHPNSPRSGKRNLKSIIPGDGNDYEEQLRLMLEECGDTETQQQEYDVEPSCTENTSLNQQQKPDTLDLPNDGSADKAVVLSGAKTPDSGLNAEWWLSGNQNNYKRFLNAPKDKATALNIISSVIDSSRKRNSKGSSSGGVTPTSVSPPSLDTRVTTHKQRNEEFEKKVTDILSTSPVSSYTDIKRQFSSSNDQQQQQYNHLQSGSEATIASSSLASNSASSLVAESNSEKLDRYLQQVALLLCDSEDTEQDKEKIARVLKQLQPNMHSSARATTQNNNNSQQQQQHFQSKRLNSDSSLPSTSTITTVQGDLNNGHHKPIVRTRSSTNSSSARKVVRTSPLLDDTYSLLNYAKLYP